MQGLAAINKTPLSKSQNPVAVQTGLEGKVEGLEGCQPSGHQLRADALGFPGDVLLGEQCVHVGLANP
jgi:hypothetical protein